MRFHNFIRDRKEAVLNGFLLVMHVLAESRAAVKLQAFFR